MTTKICDKTVIVEWLKPHVSGGNVYQWYGVGFFNNPSYTKIVFLHEV